LDQRKGVDGAAITWDFVSSDPLTEDQKQAGNAMGVYPTTTRTKQIVGWDEHWMRVIFEFHVKVLDGDSPSDALEDALGEVQRVVFLDTNCGGLTIDINEVGSDTEIGLPTDRVAQGGLAVDVRYRHRTGNPYAM
jgi:hypothetical protein